MSDMNFHTAAVKKTRFTRHPVAKPRALLGFVACLVTKILVSDVPVNAQPFTLLGVSDLVQIFEDGYNMPETTDTIQLFGLRGEILSGQCVVNAKTNLTDVTVEVSAMKTASAKGDMSTLGIAWNFVGSIPLVANASNQPREAVVRQAPARFPDYLMAERTMSLKGGSYQAVWLTVSIPENVSAGEYVGEVTIRSAQGEQSLPVSVTVYPLILPSERHLKVTEWYSTRHFAKFHGIEQEYSEEWFAMLGKYAGNMAAHRQNVFQVPLDAIIIGKSGTGELEFDFTRFDQIAEVFWRTGRMDYLETGEVGSFGEGGFASTEIGFKNFSVIEKENGNEITIPGDDVIPHLLPALERHLRQMGWLDKTLFHVKDEPAHHNAQAWIKASRTVRQYAPDLRRIDALCTSFVINDIEVACPKLDALDSGHELFRKWQQKGNELWFYTVGIFQGSMYPNKTIDKPVIDSRVLHWLNYKYDAVGYLHWGWNHWPEDPYRDTGKHIGDAYHVYPTPDGVLNTMRWEQMRNGIQDYECLWMLGQKVQTLKDSLGSRFSWIEPTQRGKEIASQVAGSLVRYSTDPGVLYGARKRLISELMEFDTSPRMYIQTSPMEHHAIINRSVVELLGWVEPGSLVAVNGRDLPVSRDGLIMGRYILYVGDQLEISVSRDGKVKTVIRKFEVTY